MSNNNELSMFCLFKNAQKPYMASNTNSIEYKAHEILKLWYWLYEAERVYPSIMGIILKVNKTRNKKQKTVVSKQGNKLYRYTNDDVDAFTSTVRWFFYAKRKQ